MSRASHLLFVVVSSAVLSACARTGAPTGGGASREVAASASAGAGVVGPATGAEPSGASAEAPPPAAVEARELPALEGAPPSRASGEDALAVREVALEAAASSARRVVVGGSGDLLAHVRVVAAGRAADGGFVHVLGDLREIITPDEIAFLNLETPLSEERTPESGSPPVLGAPPEVAAAMAAVGIDVVSMANNHAYDQWMVGAQRTAEALDAAHVGRAGAGADLDAALAPWTFVTPSGVRVALVAVTERINGTPGRSHGAGATIATWPRGHDEDRRIAAAVEAARAVADVVVVSVHWSHDFRTTPFETQRDRARFLVEHGADVILGSGPHVLQEVERLESPRGEAVCAYSLGNVVSNQGFRYRLGRRPDPGANIATWLADARDGVWLRVELEVDDGRVTIPRIEGVPLFTHNNFWERERDAALPEDIFVERLSSVEDTAVREARLAEITAALGPAVTLVP